jgi:hypothetical protein
MLMLTVATASRSTRAELVLDYVQTLIWPLLALFAVIYLRQPIKRFFDRLSSESDEITAAGPGFSIAAKFREKVNDIVESSEAADSPDLRQSLQRAAADLARDEFRAYAASFYGAPLEARQQAAKEIRRISAILPLDELLTFAGSPVPGERVAAGIGLGVHMQSSPAACTDPRVGTALGLLLDDAQSRVRYRAVEATRACPEIRDALEQQLRAVAQDDPNADVRKAARRTLTSS